MNPTTIFYVDDDQDDLEFFEMSARSFCDDLHLFCNSSDMIRLLNNPPPTPTIIFLDLNMPVPNGYEILKKIRENQRFASTPVIIYSTASDERTADKCYELGADYFLPKITSINKMKINLQSVVNKDWANFQRTRKSFIHRS